MNKAMEKKIQKELELLKSNIDSYMIKTEKQLMLKDEMINMLEEINELSDKQIKSMTFACVIVSIALLVVTCIAILT